MDRRQDQIIFIEQWHPGLITRGVRRIECEVGEKAFAGRISARNLFKLDQVCAARLRILVNSIQVRFVPQTGAFEIGRPV